MLIVLVVLVFINTFLIGLMYFRWGRQIEAIGDAQNIAKAYYSMAKNNATEVKKTLSEVPKAVEESIRKATENNSGVLG